MKGLSTFLSYTFTILLGFTIVTLFSLMIFRYYDQVLMSNIQASLKQVAVQTTNGIISLYEKSKNTDATPKNSSSIIISEIDLNYPNKISGKNFEVEFLSSPGIWNQIINITIDDVNRAVKKETNSGTKIVVKTTQNPVIIYEHSIPNIPIILQGEFRSGDNDTLKLVRYNYNGDLIDSILLGESNIIIGLTSIT